MFWGKEGERAFEHGKSGYELRGAHAPLACRSCHRKESIPDPGALVAHKVDLARTFLGLDRRCESCHADVHRGQFAGADCASCHGQAKFRPAELFDHARTKFPLTLGHVKVACAGCHRNPASEAGGSATAAAAVTYRGTPAACSACHKDPHQGRFGSRCESCHTADDWKRIQTANFDHRKTRYPLTGKHLATACSACHPPGKPTRIEGFDRCATCHTDAHAGQLARRPRAGECEECHTTAQFRPSTFTATAHESTPFPLLGAHLTTDCVACHRPLGRAELERAGVALAPVEPSRREPATAKLLQLRFARTGCADCHRDPHAGATVERSGAAGCLDCHDLTTWRAIRFDHGRTKFALAGRHGALSCLACHVRDIAPVRRPLEAARATLPAPSARAWATPREVPLRGAPAVCAGCHADAHLGQVGPSCERCHDDSGWGPNRFEHNRDSTYRLEGAHRAVACLACHPRQKVGDREVVRLKPLGTACADCHRSAVQPL